MNLTLPFPPTLNNLFRNVPMRGRVPTKKYEQWQKLAMGELMVQKARPVFGPVRVSMSFVRPDKRKRDLDNLMKAPLDILVKAGVIQDDSLITEIAIRWSAPGGQPCSITVRPA